MSRSQSQKKGSDGYICSTLGGSVGVDCEVGLFDRTHIGSRLFAAVLDAPGALTGDGQAGEDIGDPRRLKRCDRAGEQRHWSKTRRDRSRANRKAHASRVSNRSEVEIVVGFAVAGGRWTSVTKVGGLAAWGQGLENLRLAEEVAIAVEATASLDPHLDSRCGDPQASATD